MVKGSDHRRTTIPLNEFSSMAIVTTISIHFPRTKNTIASPSPLLCHYPSKQVAVVGAAGGIGQPLSMLFKLDMGVTHLHLHDLVHTPGVAADLSHIPTPADVKAFKGMLSP